MIDDLFEPAARVEYLFKDRSEVGVSLVESLRRRHPLGLLHSETRYGHKQDKLENIKKEDVGGMLVEKSKDSGEIQEPKVGTPYHASIKAAPFEALYGRECRSLTCYAGAEVGKFNSLGPEFSARNNREIIQVTAKRMKPLAIDKRATQLKTAEQGPQYVSCIQLKEMLFYDPLVVPLGGLQWMKISHFVEEPVEIMDLKSTIGGQPVSQLSRFDGTLGGALSLRGNVKISSGRNIHTSSPRPHHRQVPYISDDIDICFKLVKQESVILLPGVTFSLKNRVRITFAAKPSSLEEALDTNC
ncbi:putative reverse transcriptase domain-containing protein [Tanacetum coccineum]